MGFADHTLRVIIHTTNIRRPDLELKTNAAYLESFPLKIKSNCSPKPCEFEADLLAYLESYKYNTLHQWSSDDTTPSQKLTKELGRYDFSKAQVVLIPSTPGWYSYSSRPKGYLKLSEAIRARVAKRDVSTPIVAEFSSIGSLHKKWLQEFYQSLDCAQNDCKDLSKLKVVYPTVEEIRLSVEGYAGGQSVPGNTKNVEKAVVKPLYHKWASTEDHPLHKPSNVPHIKTYYQLTHEDDGRQSMEWFCLTSHNLSKAAWGEKQNTKFGQKLFMRHWELGVVVFPPKGGTLGPVPACGSSNSLAVSIPLPFQLKPSRYDISDQPWAVDKHYQKADGFGRTDCRG